MTLQNGFWPSRALYGSVCNSEYWIPHVFLSAHLLFFHGWGRSCEVWIRFWDLGSSFWPRNLFGVKNGSRKKWLCDGIILSWQFRGFPVTQMNSMVHRSHLGRLLCPKPLFLIIFKGFPDVQENWWDPLGTLWPYFPCLGSTMGSLGAALVSTQLCHAEPPWQSHKGHTPRPLSKKRVRLYQAPGFLLYLVELSNIFFFALGCIFLGP